STVPEKALWVRALRNSWSSVGSGSGVMGVLAVAEWHSVVFHVQCFASLFATDDRKIGTISVTRQRFPPNLGAQRRPGRQCTPGRSAGGRPGRRDADPVP